MTSGSSPIPTSPGYLAAIPPVAPVPPEDALEDDAPPVPAPLEAGPPPDPLPTVAPLAPAPLVLPVADSSPPHPAPASATPTRTTPAQVPRTSMTSLPGPA